VYVVSYPKSGRTWLHLMLGKAVCAQFGVAEVHMLRSRKFTRAAGLSRTAFTHARSLPSYRDKNILFLVRDPRDVVVSAVKYGAYMNEKHPLHKYYWGELQNDEQRYNAIVQGIEDPVYQYSSIRVRYQSYIDWLGQPGVLCLRFEDLATDQVTAIGRILDYFETKGFRPRVSRQQAVETLVGALDPARSGTYRKGQPGSWRNNFTAKNVAVFKQTAGDILVQLGYEKDMDW